MQKLTGESIWHVINPHQSIDDIMNISDHLFIGQNNLLTIILNFQK